MSLSLQISVNNDEPLFCSLSFYICKNIKKSNDPELEIVSYPESMPMRPIFGGKSSFFMYYTLGIPQENVEPLVFRYKSKNYSLVIRNRSEKLVNDIEKRSHEFGVITIKSSDDENFENLYTLFEKAYKEFEIFMQNAVEQSTYIADGTYWETIDKLYCRDLDSIYLPKQVKESVISKLDLFYSPDTVKIYKNLGITHKNVFLFEGVAGTGKTSFIAALAAKYGYSVATLYFNCKLDDNMLVRLTKNLPLKSWLLIEDMDYLFQDRKTHDGAKNMITLSGLLNCLDGITTKDGFVCWLTTNNKQALDPALIRPGRVDQIVTFDYAIPEQVESIYKKFMGDHYTAQLCEKFQTALNHLHIKYTTSILQQYLLHYIGNPEAALKNIEDMKRFHISSIIDAGAENMYN